MDRAVSVSDLASMTGLTRDEIEQMLEVLVHAGAVLWEKPIRSLDEPTDAALEVDLAPERQQQIERMHGQLDRLTFYELLGLSETASRADVRKAYFERSKLFHPDTLFRKRLGSFKPKMEAIFKKLTEAYEVLGHPERRWEYDAYEQARANTREAQDRLDEAEQQAANMEVSQSQTTSDGPPASGRPQRPSRPSIKPTTRNRLARQLAQATGRPLPLRSSPSAAPAPARSVDSEQRLQMLATSLQQAAVHTGGPGRSQPLVEQAEQAEQSGDLVGAVNSLRLALALTPTREDVRAAHARVSRKLAESLAPSYEKQAEYEERAGQWTNAAISWAKVCEGRPADAAAARRAARCLIAAGGDLHTAKRYAEKAVELEPNNAANRRMLGEVFRAGKMALNARREFEAALKLDPGDQMVKNLLAELRR